MRLRAPALLVASALVLGGLVAPAQAASAPPLPDPYFAYGNAGYDVGHYRIRDRYDPATDRLSGTTRLTATTTTTLSTLTLDLVLKVDAVRVDGVKAAYAHRKGRKLAITLPKTYAPGSRLTVVVKYHGTPGKIRKYGVRPWVTDGTETVAFGEPEICAWWYACNDHPSDKATYDIFINAPKRNQVLSNGILVKKKENRRRVLAHWRMSEPMASYLAYFAVGPYKVRSYRADGRPVMLAVSKQLAPGPRKKAMRMLKRTPADVRWLESQLGPYPFPSVGGVVIGLYVGFALENQGGPVYPYWGSGEAVHSVQVHELAHQWFGDSVSVLQWKDIWLNEGFATYMEWAYRAAHGGASVDSQLQNAYDHYTSASFWSLKIGDPGPVRLFDNAVYDRGAMTLAALANVVGAPTLTTILRGWVAKYRYSNASIADFVSYAEAVSGKDLGAFFRAWLYTAGKPAATPANGLA